jgi:hypothetical protein
VFDCQPIPLLYPQIGVPAGRRTSSTSSYFFGKYIDVSQVRLGEIKTSDDLRNRCVRF